MNFNNHVMVDDIPFLKDFWNHKRNKSIKPEFVPVLEESLVWWKCCKNHEFKESPYRMSKKSINNFCPECVGIEKRKKQRRKKNHIGLTHPDVAKTFHEEINYPVTIEDVTKGCNRKLYWRCNACNHVFPTLVSVRINNFEYCPECCRRKPSPSKLLSVTYPELVKEWHPALNKGITPESVSYGSSKKVFWMCKTCSNVWNASICSRTNGGSGCPDCSRLNHTKFMKNFYLVERDVHIGVTSPFLKDVFHKSKNKPIKIEHLGPSSSRMLWWTCPHCNKSFEESVRFMVKLVGRSICSNCNKKMYEFHPPKN